MKSTPTLLTVLPGSDETHRVAIFLADDHGALELQHQSWGEGVGWFTQSSVTLDPVQASLLKQTLGSHKSAGSPNRARSAVGSHDRPALRVVTRPA